MIPRSTFINLLSWLMMICGGLGLPLSALFVVFALGKSYATRDSDLIFCAIMVLGPTTMLLTGFGLWKRYGWSWISASVLLALVIVGSTWQLMKKPHPSNTYLDENGALATYTGASAKVVPALIIGVCVALMLKMLSRGVRAEFHHQIQRNSPSLEPTKTASPENDPRAWRVDHRGRGMMYYEEKIDGEWQRIDIDGEMLTGRAHHVIYFASAERWQNYPEWAMHRRAEIIARIKSKFREPDYEYNGDA